MIIENWLAVSLISSVMIIDWWVDPEESTMFKRRSSIESNQWCCTTYRPYLEWRCRWYTHFLSVKCLVVLPFQLDNSLVRFLEPASYIPFMTITVMNHTKVTFCPTLWHMNLSIEQRKVGCGWLWFLFLSLVSWDQRCSETPQFRTNRWI